MELIKCGKTKDVFKLENNNILLKFKDTVTGNNDGTKDPGGNKVVGSVEGIGREALKITTYYFNLLKENNIETHFISSNLEKNEMIVENATMFGKGLEFVVRYFAYGSFLRRFELYVNSFEPLDGILEITIKDDQREDPPITEDILITLGIMTKEEYEKAKALVRKAASVIRDDLANKNLLLVDLKLEVGLVDGKIVIIDEVSFGNMRVFKDNKKLEYSEFCALIL